MTKANTHLIIADAKGDKYRMARRLGVTMVSAAWIIDRSVRCSGGGRLPTPSLPATPSRCPFLPASSLPASSLPASPLPASPLPVHPHPTRSHHFVSSLAQHQETGHEPVGTPLLHSTLKPLPPTLPSSPLSVRPTCSLHARLRKLPPPSPPPPHSPTPSLSPHTPPHTTQCVPWVPPGCHPVPAEGPRRGYRSRGGRGGDGAFTAAAQPDDGDTGQTSSFSTGERIEAPLVACVGSSPFRI